MKLYLTKRAVRQYHNIQEYLSLYWGNPVVSSFKNKTLHLFDLLEQYPEIGRVEDKKRKIRGVLLTKHTRVFYRLKGNQIIILSFFDVRQKPGSKK